MIDIQNIKNGQYVLVTPEMAQELIDHNVENNRKIDMKTVRRYASDMQDGLWRDKIPNHSIILARKGGNWYMIDGQHRCLAVIQFGRPVLFKFEFARLEDLPYLDLGKSRNAKDMLTIKGLPQSGNVVALARYVYAAKFGEALLSGILQMKIDKACHTSVSEMHAYSYSSQHYEMLREYVNKAQKMYKRTQKKGSIKTYGFFLWMLDWLTPTGSDAFFEEYSKEFSTAVCVRYAKEKILKMYFPTRDGIKVKVTNKDIIEVLLASYDRFVTRQGTKPQKKDIDAVSDKYNQLILEKREKERTA